MQTETIQIPLSKTKLVLLLLASLVFVASAIWLLLQPPLPRGFFWGSTFMIKSIGIVTILFFGSLSLFIGNKLRDTQPGLTISAEGIKDNSSAVAAGLIPWQDIREIKEVAVFKENFCHKNCQNSKVID